MDIHEKSWISMIVLLVVKYEALGVSERRAHRRVRRSLRNDVVAVAQAATS